MTTSDERRRNLIWGRETLDELSEDGVLSADLRIEAATLLGGYPPLARLQQADPEDLDLLQEEFVQVLSHARWLFIRIRKLPSSTEQRRYSLQVVLRHFI
jgi:hypothetical protein